jgi:hypothetical protein
VQAWITGLIVAIAVALVGVRVWRSWGLKPTCTCGLEEEDCCLGCDGCERVRALAAIAPDQANDPNTFSAERRKS